MEPGEYLTQLKMSEALPLFGFDPSIVPDIDFCQKDSSVIESEVVTNYEKYFYLITRINKTLGRADPVRLFLLTNVYQLVVQRSIADSTGKENLLKYSHGANLDNVGAKWGDRGLRLKATSSQATLRFTLSSLLTTDSTIPLGTIAQTAAGQRFKTVQDGTIKTGDLTIDLPAESETKGASTNGLVPGQINQLVSWNSPFLVTVANTTTASGGADVEEDDHLRARIWMAPESLSTAGPKEGYEYWGGSANPDIVDVSVYSGPEVAGKVYIYPLMKGGRLPTQAECDQVYAACNADRIRPLTDQVFVQAPTAVNYIATIKYWIKQQDSQFVSTLQPAIEGAYADWLVWQQSKIGRDIVPSRLIQMMIDAGAKRIQVVSPVFTVLDAKSLAVNDPTSSCTYQGLEEE